MLLRVTAVFVGARYMLVEVDLLISPYLCILHATSLYIQALEGLFPGIIQLCLPLFNHVICK